MHLDQDLLHWWKEQKTRFLDSVRITHGTLAVPATSAQFLVQILRAYCLR